MPSTRALGRQHLGGRLGIFKAQRDGMIAPRIVEHMAAIGREHQLEAQTLGRFGKDPRLIAGGRADQQNRFLPSLIPPPHHPTSTTYTRANCSSVGSAQQYQGSSM